MQSGLPVLRAAARARPIPPYFKPACFAYLLEPKRDRRGRLANKIRPLALTEGANIVRHAEFNDLKSLQEIRTVIYAGHEVALDR